MNGRMTDWLRFRWGNGGMNVLSSHGVTLRSHDLGGFVLCELVPVYILFLTTMAGAFIGSGVPPQHSSNIEHKVFCINFAFKRELNFLKTYFFFRLLTVLGFADKPKGAFVSFDRWNNWRRVFILSHLHNRTTITSPHSVHYDWLDFRISAFWSWMSSGGIMGALFLYRASPQLKCILLVWLLWQPSYPSLLVMSLDIEAFPSITHTLHQ